MDEKKSLTLNGINTPHLILIILSLCTVGITIYLTKHYFEVHFPTGLASFALCDISSFWTCEGATYSPFSSIAGIPTSIFGLIFATCLLLGSVFPSEEFERTNHLVVIVNLIGCLALLVYSLTVLGSLCPFCTLYYLISGIIFYLFKKQALPPGIPGIKAPASFVLIAVIFAGGVRYSVAQEEKKVTQLKSLLIQQFFNLPTVDESKLISPHYITLAKDKFGDAPIKVSMFSDFQCPACGKLSEAVESLVKQYQGKVDMQYFFYPLDANCNTEMKRQLHPYACEAAYLASCVPAEKFAEVHDEIFHNQSILNSKWLNDKANEYGVIECKTSQQTKDHVKKLLDIGNSIEVQSTPTIVINGRKLLGTLPINQFKIIFDELIERAGK